MSDYVLPCVVGVFVLYGVWRKIDVFDAFVGGARDNMKLMLNVFPSLICLMLAVNMFRASGAMDVLCDAVSKIVGGALPKEVLPLAFLRPLSGAGALAAFGDILQKYGPDSYAGRVAAVMMGSTETTFYTIALYYGAVGIKKGRHTIPSAVGADLTGFLVSALVVGLFFYR